MADRGGPASTPQPTPAPRPPAVFAAVTTNASRCDPHGWRAATRTATCCFVTEMEPEGLADSQREADEALPALAGGDREPHEARRPNTGRRRRSHAP